METIFNEHLFQSNLNPDPCMKLEGQGSSGGVGKHIGGVIKKKESKSTGGVAGYPCRNSGSQRQVNEVVTNGSELTVKVTTGYLHKMLNMCCNYCFCFSLQCPKKFLLMDIVLRGAQLQSQESFTNHYQDNHIPN